MGDLVRGKSGAENKNPYTHAEDRGLEMRVFSSAARLSAIY
jgi:hypothetical protein